MVRARLWTRDSVLHLAYEAQQLGHGVSSELASVSALLYIRQRLVLVEFLRSFEICRALMMPIPGG